MTGESVVAITTRDERIDVTSGTDAEVLATAQEVRIEIGAQGPQGASGLLGVDGKAYQLVSGTIKNNGSGTWIVLDDASHGPIGVASVTTASTYVRVNYDSAGVEVVSFVCGVDETFARNGYTCGASVGLSYADISLVSMPQTIGGYAAWTGSGFTITGATGGATVSAFDAVTGKLTIAHDAIGNTIANVSGRRTGYAPILDTIGSTTTEIYWKNDSGVVQTAGHTNMKAFFSRSSALAVADPTATNISAANIWFIGIIEAA